jgi:hypothetical protein
MKKLVALMISHAAVLAAGFALGIYALPILTAPDGPTAGDLETAIQAARYTGEFRRDLDGSDFLHWGEGKVHVGPDTVVLAGSLAPGPDYRLYLSPVFVHNEAEFLATKAAAAEVGRVVTFRNFAIPIPPGVDPGAYTSVVVWCESFGEFISAAEYRSAEPAGP